MILRCMFAAVFAMTVSSASAALSPSTMSAVSMSAVGQGPMRISSVVSTDQMLRSVEITPAERQKMAIVGVIAMQARGLPNLR